MWYVCDGLYAVLYVSLNCCGGVGGVGGEWVWGLESGTVGWFYVCVVSLNSLCRWKLQVSVYCAWRIPAHLRCTQCSILLHIIDICFITCIFICGRYCKYRFVCV